MYGSKCKICGFDFEKIYGKQFSDEIHIHHINPLHQLGESCKTDPQQDLIPVCPNCHLILHAKSNGTYTVDEVKAFIKIQKDNM